MIRVFDGVLPDPMAYRVAALAQSFGDVTLGGDTFRGIAEPPDDSVSVALRELYSAGAVALSFLRKSPEGQAEPNYIHSDADMGKATAIFYLNPNPADGDGTTFWSRDGVRSGPWTDKVAASARKMAGWTEWEHVPAKFNRAVVFSSDLFHSRALRENYGSGNEARLIQVGFLR